MTKESQLLASINRIAWRTAFISLTVALLFFIAAPLLPASSLQQKLALMASAGFGLLFIVAGFLYFVTELKQPTRSIEQVRANRISSPPPGWRGLALTGVIWLLGMGLLATFDFYWSPLAAAPHLTFQEIYDQMKLAQEFSPKLVITAGSIALLIQLGVGALHLLWCEVASYTGTRAIGWLALGTWFSLTVAWLAWGFHMSMGLADTFAISGGDYAVAPSILVSVIMTALFLTGIYGLLRPAPRHSAPSALQEA